MNAVAPGITQTTMTDQVFADATWGKAIREFSELTLAAHSYARYDRRCHPVPAGSGIGFCVWLGALRGWWY